MVFIFHIANTDSLFFRFLNVQKKLRKVKLSLQIRKAPSIAPLKSSNWLNPEDEAYSDYFWQAEIGLWFGTSTWGGLIGISGNPQPIDGGRVTAPTFGFWNTEGDWEVEGYGVEPDYEIENAPHEMVAGRDPQLEKAIEVVLEMLAKEPLKKLKKPAYPDRSDMTDQSE